MVQPELTFSYWIEIDKLCFAKDIFLERFSTPSIEVLGAPLSVLVGGALYYNH